MLAVTRYAVAAEDADGFLERARAALAALAARPGYRSGSVGRSTDDPARWVLVTEWDGVGVYRRALSAYDVKVDAVPLLSLAVDEPTAYEVLAVGPQDEEFGPLATMRAVDADEAGPGGR